MNKKDSPLFIAIMFVIFTFLGVGTLYALTTFDNPFTSNKSVLATKIYKEDDSNSVTYSRFFIKENDITSIKINNKVVNMSYSEDKSNLLFNGDILISISKKKSYEFFNYNDEYIIIYVLAKKQNTGVLYVVNHTGEIVDYVTEVDLRNRIMTPYSIELEDNDLIINAKRIKNEKLMIISNYYMAPSICEEKEMNQYRLIQDDIASGRYSLTIDNGGKAVFKLVGVLETIEDYSERLCK